MFRRLGVRLAGALAGLTLAVLLLVAYKTNFAVHRHFEKYMQDKVRDRSDRIASLLSEAYNSGWSPSFLDDLTQWLLMEGLTARIVGPDDREIWSSVANARRLSGPLAPPAATPGANDFSVRVPVVAEGKTVASLRVYAGPTGLISEQDLAFKRTLSGELWYTTGISLALALLLGWALARELHRPLRRMTDVAKSMQNGNWRERAPVMGALELQELSLALNHLAEALQWQDSVRKRMTRDVAHELRTPLSILQSHLEAIEDGVWEPTAERIALCHQEAIRLVTLVDDLNRLAEAEAEGSRLQRRATPLRVLLDSVASGMEPLFAKRGVGFGYSPPPDLVLTVDPDKVRQILLNLLENACKFTPPGGQTRLEVETEPPWLHIRVTDTGPGIPPAEIPLLFERLYRGDPSRSRQTGGAGLGLAISRALAESHGGHIQVESRPGQGSTFTLVLPLSDNA